VAHLREAPTSSASISVTERLSPSGGLPAALPQPAATTHTAFRTVPAGSHEVKFEYYENGGDALATVAIAP
jgi:hypothetical protein